MSIPKLGVQHLGWKHPIDTRLKPMDEVDLGDMGDVFM